MSDDLQSAKLLPIREILARYSVSDRTIDRWLATPALGFPKPLVIRRRRFWRQAEIDRFDQQRAAERPTVAS